MTFMSLNEETRLSRLAPPSGKIRLVLDTDTYNEIDDQFAVVYALNSPDRLQVEAIYAAPFHNERSVGPADGMERSYREIGKILQLAGRTDIPTFRGSDRFMRADADPVDSDAVQDLIRRAMASADDDPLYVAAIGAITNIASALLLEPRIAGKIVVVWLGGHALHWNHSKEFNLQQDPYSARVVLDSGVPLILIPCQGVASHLITTLAEIREFVSGKGSLGDYLYETFREVRDDHFGYSRVIWDLAAVAYLVNPAWTPADVQHSPRISDDCRWSRDSGRHLIRYVQHVQRDDIFKDFFRKLC